MNNIPTESLLGNLSPNSTVLEYTKPDNSIRSREHSQNRGSVGNINAVSRDGYISRKILFNIVRAIFVRALFIVHSLTTIWAAVNVRNDPSLWAFALVSLLVAIEGAYTIVLRAGNERKWFSIALILNKIYIAIFRFSPSILLYILATAPPLHLLETQICEWRKNKSL